MPIDDSLLKHSKWTERRVSSGLTGRPTKRVVLRGRDYRQACATPCLTDQRECMVGDTVIQFASQVAPLVSRRMTWLGRQYRCQQHHRVIDQLRACCMQGDHQASRVCDEGISDGERRRQPGTVAEQDLGTAIACRRDKTVNAFSG
jgi:hypothetical protein